MPAKKKTREEQKDASPRIASPKASSPSRQTYRESPQRKFQLGSHLSIAGGYYKAVESASRLGCDVVQIFTKNNNQWKAKPISDSDVEMFQSAIDRHQIHSPVSHASYLINLASPNQELWQKSIDAMVIEIERATKLRLIGVVMHPGAFVSSSEDEGLAAITRGIEEIFSRTESHSAPLLLENTAGQGSCLGWRMEHLQQLIEPFRNSGRIGWCLDSCHAHAAGFDLSQIQGLRHLIQSIDECGIGEDLKAVHLNDSKREAGSRVDRHEHIGHGTIGELGIARFIQHPLFSGQPMYLETAKGDDEDGNEWDAVNLQRTRALAMRRLKPVV